MKNYIIILICLSLLLCGCQAAGSDTDTSLVEAIHKSPAGGQ